MRDTQRQKLYRAENEALGGLPVPIGDNSVDDIRRYCVRVLTSRTAEKIVERKFENDHFEVGDGRGRRKACAENWNEIKLPIWARNKYVVLHELSHVLRMRYWRWRGNREKHEAGHGREFAATYLQLVLIFMGRPAHNALKASFKKHHVRFRPKRTRARIVTAEQLEVMRARGRQLAALRKSQIRMAQAEAA